MNPDLDAKLCATYPILYAQRGKPMTETCMCWGFDCGDGWYRIIDDLSRSLEWLNNSGHALVEAVQVKEKFGLLRVYTSIVRCDDDFPDNIVWDLCDCAEVRSGHVCEDCGKPGKLREGGWMRTLCNECEAERHAPAAGT